MLKVLILVLDDSRFKFQVFDYRDITVTLPPLALISTSHQSCLSMVPPLLHKGLGSTVTPEELQAGLGN